MSGSEAVLVQYGPLTISCHQQIVELADAIYDNRWHVVNGRLISYGAEEARIVRGRPKAARANPQYSLSHAGTSQLWP